MKKYIFLFLLFIYNTSFSQVDTLKHFPDTTTFDTEMWWIDIDNIAVKYDVPYGNFVIKKVQFLNNNQVQQGSIAFSTGNFPEESIIHQSDFEFESNYPNWNEIIFEPGITINSSSFYVTVLPLYPGTLVAKQDSIIMNHLLHVYTTGWLEIFKGYFAIKVIIDKVTNVNENFNSSNEYFLSNNFPNPFNPSTTISYSLPSNGFTTLKVYDVLGNEVATLINEEKGPGYYTVDFNASYLSSGVYFYNLTSGGFTMIKKMILMK
ncbi:MAG: T9SS type A sorting domain-containing protein [Syntrophothermus sp.]